MLGYYRPLPTGAGSSAIWSREGRSHIPGKDESPGGSFTAESKSLSHYFECSREGGDHDPFSTRRGQTEAINGFSASGQTPPVSPRG